MKKIILVCMLVLVLVFIGCEKKIECNKPYILVGSECCLDKDDNSICDRDEVKETPEVFEDKTNTAQTKSVEIPQNKIDVNFYDVMLTQNDIENIYQINSAETGATDLNYYDDIPDFKKELASRGFTDGYQIIYSGWDIGGDNYVLEQIFFRYGSADYAKMALEQARKEDKLTGEYTSLDNPAIGQSSMLEYFESMFQGRGYRNYILRFTIGNLYVKVDLNGNKDKINQDIIIGYAKKIESKILDSSLHNNLLSDPYKKLSTLQEIASESRNGVTIALNDIDFEKKSDDWGTITSLKVTITNDGIDKVYPQLRVYVYGKSDSTDVRATVRETFDPDYYLGKELMITKEYPTHITVRNLNESKTIKIALSQAFDYPAKTLVAVEKDIALLTLVK